ncbi:MAG: PspA-associated protein PspAA [Acidimicrobiales bacterium]
MIVRILGEGQYELPDDALASLEELDRQLNAAMESESEEGFEKVLGALLAKVRDTGAELSTSTLVPSDLTVPHEGSSISDVRELLASEDETTETVTEGA